MSASGSLAEALRSLLREVVQQELPQALREAVGAALTERSNFSVTPANATAEHMEFLTVGQVAAALQVTRATVRRWIVAGALQAHAVGPRGLVRVKRAALERFVSSKSGCETGALAANDIDAEAMKIVNKQRAQKGRR